MTFLATPPRPSDPPGPDRPFPGQPYPQLTQPRPGDESNPVPQPPPTPQVAAWSCHRCGAGFVHGRLLVAHLIDIHNEGPARRVAYRIGHAPRLPRRQRYVRVLRQLGRYALAEALIGWSLLWLVDVHFFVPGMVLAAMIGNPRRPKRPVRPAYAGSGSRAVHSLLLRNRASRAGLLSAQAPVRA